jgi:hypothetical protein
VKTRSVRENILGLREHIVGLTRGQMVGVVREHILRLVREHILPQELVRARPVSDRRKVAVV